MKYQYINQAFDRKIEILKEQRLFGSINFNFWDSECIMILNSKKFLFKRKSIWSVNYLLYKSENEAIAEITFPIWKQKAIINCKDFESFIISPIDFWHKNWQVLNEKGEKIFISKTNRFWHQTAEIMSEIRDEEKSDLLVGISVFILFLKMRRASKSGSY